MFVLVFLEEVDGLLHLADVGLEAVVFIREVLNAFLLVGVGIVEFIHFFLNVVSDSFGVHA